MWVVPVVNNYKCYILQHYYTIHGTSLPQIKLDIKVLSWREVFTIKVDMGMIHFSSRIWTLR